MKANKQAKRVAKRLFRLCFVNGTLDDRRVRQVVKGIVDSKRHSGMAILSYFRKLLEFDSNQHSAEVESAIPLSDKDCTRIEAQLKRAYGSSIRVDFTTNPKLIGGIKIKIGSDLYDGSIQGRLAELEKTF
jgi:F-type H+-transporting ATPase subunit delta